MAKSAGQLHLKLVDNQEVIVARMLEVDEFQRLWTPVIPIGQALRHGALEQEFCGCLVHLHQPVPCCQLQVAHGAGDSGVIEPRPPFAPIELTQGRCQPILQ
jgi:hypothetical protein